MTDKMTFEELQEIVSICLDEIVKLKEEKRKLENEVKNISESMISIINTEKVMINNIDNMNRNNNLMEIFIQENVVNNIKYEISDPRMDKSIFCYPKFYDIEDTVDDIVNGNKSMARFGDGEFEIMSNKERHDFQHCDERLAVRLRNIIQTDEEGLLIAIADNYGCLDVYNKNAKKGIRQYMTDKTRKEHMKYLDMKRVYHNAYISRPYALYVDNMTKAPKERFLNLKRIWEKRNLIMVEGSLTRMGLGNDLFDNAARICRIEAPPVNSFDKYDEILEASLKYAEKDSLFLVALGPSAGVLVYDLYKNGYQAIDIGHLDLEYEWFLRGIGWRCEVKNKYNNEVAGGDNVEEVCDEKYLKQIVCVIE